MKFSEMLIPTLREDPKDAEATSHKLMTRAGLIRKLSAGVYSYLPLGYRVLKNIMDIIRDEMNKAGAQELLLPALTPADIWKKTGRYDTMGDILMSVKKPDKQEMVLGPTHEEIITELAGGYISSYKDLPQILFQIQNKFRDEARPRFGVIRSKEFTMKDAYSFDSDWEGLDKNYKKMYAAYQSIFKRCGVDVEIVSADSGDMGGDESHEFMVKLPFGEDRIVCCSSCGLSASTEVAACGEIKYESEELKEIEEFDTPGVSAIEALEKEYKVNPQRSIKTMIYMADESPVACLVRGDFEINEAKLKKALSVKILELAEEDTILKVTGAPVGFAGPVGLSSDIKVYADLSVKDLPNAVVGANKQDKHIRNVNQGRDYEVAQFADFRHITEGDECPSCGQTDITLDRTLEVGHVFKLGTKYTKDLGALFTDKDGKTKEIVMGCYGIGVNRIVAAAIELNNDEKGIKWPLAIAPFKVQIITINQKDEESAEFAEKLHADLTAAGIDVLYDDRNLRAGVKFNDSELIGIPYSVVVGSRGLKNGALELKDRMNDTKIEVPVDEVLNKIKELVL